MEDKNNGMQEEVDQGEGFEVLTGKNRHAYEEMVGESVPFGCDGWTKSSTAKLWH